MMNVDFIYFVVSSSWLEGKAKTPAGKTEWVRPRRSVATRRLSGRPWKAKPCTEISSDAMS